MLTCVLIKPDGVGKSVIGKVIARFEEEGFRLRALKLLRPSAARAEEFYAEHRGKEFFPLLLKFMSSGPIVAMAWEGNDVIRRVREMIGATDSRKAAPGTLRQLWGTDGRRNLVHASDSEPSALRETSFFFSPEELSPYDPDAWKTA